ncbi:MAG: VWA-like domain-containing protein, partial [Bacteroidales bacterium]|nr:VWA-like domain-containing protein [Bacteroidales bacterium]
VTDEVLTNFFGTVNKLFRYGQVQIDVCQFDIQVNEIVPIQRAQREIKVKGRGGTSFQCIIDRVTESKTDYDGLIILTDGQAPPPVLPKNFHTPILWACHNRQSYDQNKAWMRESGRCCHL